MTDETTTETTETATPPPAPDWFIAEGMPGTGPRPDWLEPKFKSVAHLAESYKEMEKRVGYVPEEYDLSKSKYIDPDYEPFQELKQLAKDKRVPKEVLDKMVESVDKYMDEFSTDWEEEVKRLGDNAKERVTKVDNWVKATVSKESYEALVASVKTAEGIKALEELRGKAMSENTQVPGGNEGASSASATVEQLTQELTNNLQKYKDDPKYRDDLRARIEIASKGNPNFVEKR
jgi:hypothetical protein